MGEAGLGAAEVGEKIAEHREHSMHAQPTGRDRIITIIEAALLAAVALMAAWSGFASAKWSTESRLQLAEANASRVEANRAAGTAAANKETDDLAFNAWFATAVLGNAASDGHRGAALSARVQGRIRRLDQDRSPQQP